MRVFLVFLILVSLFSLNSLAAIKKGACVNKSTIYKSCTDQSVLLNSAIETAKNNNKILIVKYGFEKCPWCHSLHKVFQESEISKWVKDRFELVSIDIKAKAGDAAISRLIEKKKIKGYPFLAFVNPTTGQVRFQDTGDLEQNTKTSKGHNLAKVKSALESTLN